MRRALQVLAVSACAVGLVMSGAAVASAKSTSLRAYTCTGGDIPSGNYSSLTVTGVCDVADNAVVSIHPRRVRRPWCRARCADRALDDHRRRQRHRGYRLAPGPGLPARHHLRSPPVHTHFALGMDLHQARPDLTTWSCARTRSSASTTSSSTTRTCSAPTASTAPCAAARRSRRRWARPSSTTWSASTWPPARTADRPAGNAACSPPPTAAACRSSRRRRATAPSA